MTVGDMARSTSPRQTTRERLLRGHQLRSARQMNRQGTILFLGLTIVWLAVLWMAVFGSRPHTYFLILAGTYTVGVLSGAGMSTLFSWRRSTPTSPEYIDPDARSVS